MKEITIKNINESLIKKVFSCEELIRDCFHKIYEDKLNDFISLFEEEAILQAKKIDEKISQKKQINILEGIPIAIKDNILIKDMRATAGSKILEKYKATYNATVIEKLQNSGSIFIGKANMDEFAMGSSNETSYFGPVLNIYDKKRVPGGSSGGSAVSVSAHHSVLALGSDTGGSIRQPAAFCGVTGFKPSYGKVSRFGLIALSSSLDQIGPIANNVYDVTLLLNTISGHDKKDATSLETSQIDLNKLKNSIKNKTIGVIKNYEKMISDPDIIEKFKETIKILKNNGVKIKEIDLSFLETALAIYYILQPAEASSNLAKYDGFRYGFSQEGNFDLEKSYFENRTNAFGDEVKRRILMGTYVLSKGYKDAYYNKAKKVQKDIKLRFNKIFKSVSCVISPTTPTKAFKLGEIKDPLTMYFSDIFTVCANIAELPAISIPISKKPLPIGLQIIGDYMQDEKVLNFAYNIEQFIK